MRTIATGFALLALCGSSFGQETIEGIPYEKLETREATYKRMRDLLQPQLVTWGDWYLLSPFPYRGHGHNDLATPHAPEEELAHMRAGGKGPDLDAVYTGKKNVRATWQELGDIANRRIDLHVHDDPELNDLASCYLYGTITAEEATEVEIHCGSDDGMRFWLNGRLLVDKDVPRGLNPEAEHLFLQVDEGTNHVFVKISEGGGSWDFQINTRDELSSRTDALLSYYLDRDFPPSPERAHYRVMTVPVPEDVALEVGGLDFFGDGAPVVATRRGEVYRVEGAYEVPPVDARFQLFAEGLHEPLGIGVRADDDGEAVYTVQRSELTRLVDADGDGFADLYDTFCDDWGVSGNYHEFAFGPEFDDDGNAWITLNVGFCGSLGKSVVPWRGWALKVTPDRQMIPVCDGLRSPNGIGRYSDGEMFYVDNQGDYVATNRLSHLAHDSWHGHPASKGWRAESDGHTDDPERQRAAVWFPYRKMGQSAADVALDDTDGRFGPFTGQLFVGDQTLASVMRVDLEVVNGHYQGACFPFLSGLNCGVNRVAFAPDGSMFVGQTDRGWGSVGNRSYGMQRIVYSGEAPFEILSVRARSDGFDLHFTKPVDVAPAGDPDSYSVTSYTYPYHSNYGAPESDKKTYTVPSVRQIDATTVRLELSELRKGYVHEISATGVRSKEGKAPLLHPTAYYTFEEIPSASSEQEAAGAADQERLPRVLFLTHSAGFTHDVVKRPAPDQLALAEEELIRAANGRFEIVATQDCGTITRESLDTFDAVVFYTTGELPIPGEKRFELFDWVSEGGAFIGIHCATDTLYEEATYMQMVGGTFDGHPWNEKVRVTVEDANHPATRHLGSSFEIADEIYQYRHFQRHPVRVLLSLDTTSIEASKGKRADGDYALAWCRSWAEGRVFYTALGHRPAVWKDARFQEHLLNGIQWAIDGDEYAPPPPPGAEVLFDGTGLERWRHRREGVDGQWKLVDGAMEVVRGTSDLVTRDEFGDGLYHVEFRIPDMPDASGQGKGNSGVYVLGRYEVQVLDSYGLEQKLGDCGSIYGKKVASRNACRKPEEWQSYDIYFTAPRFDASGRKTSDALMTVWHNGILIHDNVIVDSPTAASLASNEVERGPLLLQDHGNPVRYRNVWFLPR